MDTGKTITHRGVIQAIDSEKVKISLVNVSACSGCHAKSVCSVSDKTQKIVETAKERGAHLEVGQEVEVALDKRAGFKALAIGYILPFFLLIGVLFTAGMLVDEATAALLALAAMVPYYFTLLLFKNTFKRIFSFRLLTLPK